MAADRNPVDAIPMVPEMISPQTSAAEEKPGDDCDEIHDVHVMRAEHRNFRLLTVTVVLGYFGIVSRPKTIN